MTLLQALHDILKKISKNDKTLCCILEQVNTIAPAPEPICSYDTPTPLTEGATTYSFTADYVDAPFSANLINETSNINETIADFVTILNGLYNPDIQFFINGDGTLHVVATGFAAACFLDVDTTQQDPNITATWDSPDVVQFTSTSSQLAGAVAQGSLSQSWGGNGGPANTTGYMLFDNTTDIIEFGYTATGAFNICVHLIQNAIEVTGSPFPLVIPGAGSGTLQITALAGLLNGAQDLEILVDNAC